MTNIPSSNQNKTKGRYLAYLRVSTPKQGEGVSLLTQREEIAKFAARKHFLATGWYEEKETAAKRGRPVFGEVLKRLRKGEADGLIIHKVDRSVRNLKDWADLRAVIQAIVAADYVASVPNRPNCVRRSDSAVCLHSHDRASC
jgi:resolvase-like protein